MATADDEFSRQLGDLKKSFGDVARTIDESAESIDRTKDPQQGRKSIAPRSSSSRQMAPG